jgi:hypothetical protein
MKPMATVNKRPSGKWQATVRKDGKSQSKSFSKRADAVTWARETELRAERDGLKDRTARPVIVMTFGQVMERSLQKHERIERQILNFVLPSVW